MTNNQWVKTVEVNGRTFELVFSYDQYDFFWCYGYEIRPKKCFFDIFYKTEVFRTCTFYEDIDSIFQYGLKEIRKYLGQEEKRKEVKKALDKFADYVV